MSKRKDLPRKLVIAGVSERDVDLLLLEEFLATPSFIHWFVERTCDRSEKVSVLVGARRSVTQSDGESDLEVTLSLHDKQSLRLLIENKVNATLQPQQAERYRARGELYINNAECHSYRTVLVAPERYFGAVKSAKGFDVLLTYEQLRDWYLQNSGLGLRAGYKVALLSAAIEKGLLGYQRDDNDAVTMFWTQYWKYVSKHAPEWLMSKPTGKPAAASFIQFKPANFPPGLRLVHKLSTGNADLQFSNYGEKLDVLHGRFGRLLHSDMFIDRANKSGVIRIRVPVVNVARGFDEQFTAVETGVHAIMQLYAWFHEHRDYWR